MKAFKLMLISVLLIIAVSAASQASTTLSDCAGIIRVFGDKTSWMSDCFVVGDGSWAITSSDAIAEKIGKDSDHIIRKPVFISAYTGKACQCDLIAYDKELNIALLKLPVSGLPAAPFAQAAEFSKAAYGTYGQLTSGDPIGNKWATDIYAIAREKIPEGGYKLEVKQWEAQKVFVTDIGKYKIMFIMDTSPEKSIPYGAMISRNGNIVGMYINKLTITGGKENVVFGRCAISTEIAKFIGEHGVDTTTLYNPQPTSIEKDVNADSAFQLQMKIYSLIGAGAPGLALDSATSLIKLLPNDAQAHLLYGVALNGSGNFADAIKAFDDTAKIDPKLPTLRTNRAISLIGLNKKTEAEAELTKAAEEAPDDSRPVTALANYYLSEKSFDKALSYAQKAVSMSSDSPSLLLLEAKIEKSMKNYQSAINHIEEAIKMAPDWPDAMFALGSTFEESGDDVNAEKAYRKIVEKNPNNAVAMMTLASFLIDQGKNDEPKELIAKIRALNPPKAVSQAVDKLEAKISEKKESDTNSANK